MNKLFLGFLLLLLVPFATIAQEKEELNYSLSSPKGTITTHLRYLQENNFHPEIAAKAFPPSEVSKKEAKELAIQLKQILDGSGIVIEDDELPESPNYKDSTNNRQRYILAEHDYPDIYVQKMGNKWYYSKRTIERIPILHKEVYPFGTDKLMKILPKMGNRKILGLHTWQHISILLLILICIVVHKLLTLLFNNLIYRFLNIMGKKKVAHEYILPVARPFSLLVVFIILIIFVPILQLPITINHYLILLLKAALPLFATVMVYKMVDVLGAYLLKMASKTETTMDDQIVPILKRVLKIFVIIIGALFILDQLRFDVTALLAGISIGGLAFALAAQETIKNFFGSLMILFDKPFQIGDWITAGDVDGTVEEVGFRSTRVRTFRNSLITVPNGKLADMTVDNHGLRKYRRFYTTITVTYGTPPHLMQTFVDGLNKIVAEHPKTWKDFYQIHFNNMSAYSLDIMFYIFFDVPSWDEELKCRHEVLMSIVKYAKEIGVQFAFPTQTLHMENFPGQESLSPTYGDSPAESMAKMDAYFKQQSSNK